MHISTEFFKTKCAPFVSGRKASLRSPCADFRFQKASSSFNPKMTGEHGLVAALSVGGGLSPRSIHRVWGKQQGLSCGMKIECYNAPPQLYSELLEHQKHHCETLGLSQTAT